MLFYTIYTSTPRMEMDSATLESITDTANKNNKRDGITGMLLGIEGKYLQYLEGDEEKVVSLFERIKSDGRHHQINQWVKGYIEKPIFGEWSMGSWMLHNEELEKLSALADIKKYLKSSGSSTPTTRFIQMMNDLLQAWLAHEPERAARLHH